VARVVDGSVGLALPVLGEQREDGRVDRHYVIFGLVSQGSLIQGCGGTAEKHKFVELHEVRRLEVELSATGVHFGVGIAVDVTAWLGF